MKTVLALVLILLTFALPASAGGIYNPPSASGGSTACTGQAAGSVLYGTSATTCAGSTGLAYDATTLSITKTFTDLPAEGFFSGDGLKVVLTANPSADSSGSAGLTGLNVFVTTPAENDKDFGALYAAYGLAWHVGSGTINLLYGGYFEALADNAGVGYIAGVVAAGETEHTSGTQAAVYGLDAQATNFGAGNVTALYAVKATIRNLGAGTIASAYGLYVLPPQSSGGGAITTNYGLWLGDQTSSGGTSDYAFWYDSPGVYRIKSDGVMAYYNPDFSPKYTPDATDHERVVQQWNGNVLEYGTEAGGTGVLRGMRLLGASLYSDALKTTSGAAGGKKVVCVDTATGLLHVSSTSVDCTN
jgi:hypothetical protein